MDGNAALVTGTGSGLGAAIARRLGADGAVAAVGDLKGASALDLLTPQIPSGRRAGGC